MNCQTCGKFCKRERVTGFLTLNGGTVKRLVRWFCRCGFETWREESV